MESTTRVGFDLGGVIVGAVDGSEGVAVRELGEVPPVEGAVAGVRQLSSIFDGRIWIVSKASTDTEAWSRACLHSQGLVGPGVVPVEHLVFVSERIAKRAACEARGITDFVDDKPDNLISLRGVVDRLYQFGGPDVADSGLRGATRVSCWPELTDLLSGLEG
jgi:hypothetical protein